MSPEAPMPEQPLDPRPSGTGPRIALVLAGGGALGAYEAGVLHYILDTLGRELSPPPRFSILAGTSVGALNASFLAANAHRPAHAIRQLVQYWESITFERILRFGHRELALLVRLVLGQGQESSRFFPTLPPVPEGAPHPPVAGLFDVSALHKDMRTLIAWDDIQHNLDTSQLCGLALCATEVCTGTGMIFYGTCPRTEYRPGRDPSKEAQRVRFTVNHAMASAAIPFLFPAVQVDGVCYTDGALRQNTPLNPALRLGADRVLVVSLTEDPTVASPAARVGCRRNPFPGALFLLGKTVRVLLGSTLDYELARVEMYNRLIRGGQELYGPGFADNLNRIMGSIRNADYRLVQTGHIRPSQNLERLAQRALRQSPNELKLPGAAGTLMSRLLHATSFMDSDLLGFLMFTPTYIRALLSLGYHDAKAHRAQLTELFCPAEEATR